MSLTMRCVHDCGSLQADGAAAADLPDIQLLQLLHQLLPLYFPPFLFPSSLTISSRRLCAMRVVHVCTFGDGRCRAAGFQALLALFSVTVAPSSVASIIGLLRGPQSLSVYCLRSPSRSTHHLEAMSHDLEWVMTALIRGL